MPCKLYRVYSRNFSLLGIFDEEGVIVTIDAGIYKRNLDGYNGAKGNAHSVHGNTRIGEHLINGGKFCTTIGLYFTILWFYTQKQPIYNVCTVNSIV